MTFLDFPEHCFVEKKKKDQFHSLDAKDIQNRKKKKNQGVAKVPDLVLMTRYKENINYKEI